MSIWFNCWAAPLGVHYLIDLLPPKKIYIPSLSEVLYHAGSSAGTFHAERVYIACILKLIHQVVFFMCLYNHRKCECAIIFGQKDLQLREGGEMPFLVSTLSPSRPVLCSHLHHSSTMHPSSNVDGSSWASFAFAANKANLGK